MKKRELEQIRKAADAVVARINTLLMDQSVLVAEVALIHFLAHIASASCGGSAVEAEDFLQNALDKYTATVKARKGKQ